MNFLTAGISIGLVSLAALTVQAGAADMPGQRMGGGGYGQAAVPVPAPVPYEEHYKWYIGGGVGYAVRSDSGVSSSVTNLTVGSGLGIIESQDGPVYASVVAGRYLTPSLRLEFGMDFRAKQKIVSGTHIYQATYYGDGSLVAPNSQNYNVYDVTHTEKAHLTTNTYMLSAFQEFGQGRKIRPYVGAGVGFATHYLKRDLTESATCVSGGNTVDATIVSCALQPDLPFPVAMAGSASTTGFGLAAALMAGATVDIGPRTHLDVGYRLMYMGSKTVTALPDSLGSFTTINVGARTDHELRTTVRFDLW